MGNRRNYLMDAIVEICQKMDQKGWVANHDGNISLKFEGNLLATPTAVSKGDIVPAMLLDLDMSGKKLAGVGKPFSEIKLHLAAYNARGDVDAVVHAHPPFAMARGMVGEDFSINVPEAVVSIGAVIPVAAYAFPGSRQNDAIVASALAQADVFMMAGNGVLAVGRDLKEAYLRMELLEHLVKIDYYARSMGTAMTLPPQDKQKLLEKRASIGLGPTAVRPISEKTVAQTEAPVQNDVIKDLIAQELKKVLQQK